MLESPFVYKHNYKKMSSKSSTFLETDRLYLEKLGREHVSETYLGWLHNKKVNAFLETGKTPTTLDEIASFIENSTAILFLAIFEKETKKHIGNIKIDRPHPIHNTAEYGILIGDEFWGKGYAKEASIAVLDHSFKVLNIRKITLGFVSDNVAAKKLYVSLGFHEEGNYKDHVFQGGKYHDIYRMAIFQEGWLK